MGELDHLQENGYAMENVHKLLKANKPEFNKDIQDEQDNNINLIGDIQDNGC